MRRNVSTCASLLAGIMVAFWLTVIRAQILVRDNFVNEPAREALLAQLPGQPRFKHTLELPRRLYQRLVSVLQPTRATGLIIATSVPVRENGPPWTPTKIHTTTRLQW